MGISLLTVVGARPQFIKAAVISRLVRSSVWENKFSEYLVHTGQHYDSNMSDIFFDELSIPRPDINLAIGGTSHGQMTARMLIGIEEAILEQKPDLVLVYGDTNSTLAGALAASKLAVPVAHVEAGLRSFYKKMPEEQNRILTDRLSTWLFCPTETAVNNLRDEGIKARIGIPSLDSPGVINVGDIMYDASLFYRNVSLSRPRDERFIEKAKIKPPFHLLTLHRAENTDDKTRLSDIFYALNNSGLSQIILPMHPRTNKMIEKFGLRIPDNIRVIEPVGFLDMLDLEQACEGVITDSGGVQKEAYFFCKPCITLRDQTEWIETVASGWNRLVGADSQALLDALTEPFPNDPPAAVFGTGAAGEQILAEIERAYL